MLFHTTQFFYFLCIVFAVYWALPGNRPRKLWLLAASCYFYMSWNPWLITLVALSASIDFAAALKIESMASPRLRRLILGLSIGCNLTLLGFFKYMNFFLDSVHSALGCFGVQYDQPLYTIILPLGISFYTFEAISYVVDVYRGRIKAERNLLDYALFIMFFPHLIAGPIVRPRDFLPQLARAKRFRWERMQLGVKLFLVGLFKKAILADHLATIVDPVFKTPEAYASSMVWLAVLAYAGQIFCDFSGYTDMAIGAAHMFGFKLRPNFNMPYLAASITDFWRRWHISLSSWLRDYLYIPLGGNRGGAWSTYKNLLLTMLLGGLWHGAAWTFLLWGLYHGGLLALQRALPWPGWMSRAWFRPAAVLGTFLLVCVGWVFFRAQSVSQAWIILERLAAPAAGAVLHPATVAMGALCLGVLLLGHLLGQLVSLERWERRLPAPFVGMAMATALMLILALMPVANTAFIYFQF
jgi:alginate O-acetyltransferase complex protein AlgI